MRDARYSATDLAAFPTLEYVDVYLRYWEQYHLRLALSGLPARSNTRLIVYGGERMRACTGEWNLRFGAMAGIEAFREADYQKRHPDWRARCDAAVLRVNDVWCAMGLRFPLDEIMEAC